MNQIDRHTFPPGGWQFFQPQTMWKAPTPTGSTFDQTVVLIIKHRQQNPAVVAKHALSLDPATVANELENFTRARLDMPLMGADVPKSSQPLRLPRAVAEAVAAAGKLADGVGLLLEWLPQGQSIAPELAEKRAAVCAACPKNSDKAFASWFTVPVSQKLQRMVEARKDLHLETTQDDKLGVCAICLCPLKLKTWIDIGFISSHTKPQTLNEFPADCWIPNEIRNGNKGAPS